MFSNFLFNKVRLLGHFSISFGKALELFLQRFFESISKHSSAQKVEDEVERVVYKHGEGGNIPHKLEHVLRKDFLNF